MSTGCFRRSSRTCPAGKAATEAARQTGLPRRDLYQRLIDLKGGDAGKAADPNRLKAFRRGYVSEYIAALYLVAKGYRIRAIRYRTKLGEIDIIARRGDLIVCVEVKARRDVDSAVFAVTGTTRTAFAQPANSGFRASRTAIACRYGMILSRCGPGGFQITLWMRFDQKENVTKLTRNRNACVTVAP